MYAITILFFENVRIKILILLSCAVIQTKLDILAICVTKNIKNLKTNKNISLKII